MYYEWLIDFLRRYWTNTRGERRKGKIDNMEEKKFRNNAA